MAKATMDVPTFIKRFYSPIAADGTPGWIKFDELADGRLLISPPLQPGDGTYKPGPSDWAQIMRTGYLSARLMSFMSKKLYDLEEEKPVTGCAVETVGSELLITVQFSNGAKDHVLLQAEYTIPVESLLA